MIYVKNGTSFEEIYTLLIQTLKKADELQDYISEEDLEYEFLFLIKKAIYGSYLHPLTTAKKKELFAYTKYSSIGKDKEYQYYYFDNILEYDLIFKLVEAMSIAWLEQFEFSSNLLNPRQNTSTVSQSSPANLLNAIGGMLSNKTADLQQSVNNEQMQNNETYITLDESEV